MRSRGVVLVIVVVLVLAGGLVAQQRMRAAAPPDPAPPAAPPREAAAVEVQPARLGSIEQTLELTGTVVSARRVDLTPKTAGRIARVYVQEGGRVAAGTPIAALETAELAAQVRQAEQGVRQAAAAREVARARLASVLAGARSQERAQAESAVAQADANLRNAESEVARLQQLLDAGAVSRQQLEAAILRRDVARAQLESARQQLSLVRTGAREEDVRMARAQLEQAEAGYGAAVAALQLARVQLDSATIRAPFAGRIAELPVTPGEFVTPGATVAALYDDRHLEVEVMVGERDLRLVRPGHAVTIRADAVPAAVFAGRVSRIQPAADPLSRAARVRIAVRGIPPLLPGTSVRAALLVERRDRVVVVPAGAVRQNGQPEVVVVRDGKAQIRRVVVGLRQRDLVQIVYGVAAGELVVTLGPEALGDGQPVRVVNR